MHKKIKILISILSIMILVALGIELVSGNIIEMMSIKKSVQELKEINARVANFDDGFILQSGKVDGASPEQQIEGGDEKSGANVSAQYLYREDSYCGGHGLTIARREHYRIYGEWSENDIIVDKRWSW